MKNKNLIRFMQSLMLFPAMTIGVHQTVLVPQLNITTNEILAFNQAKDSKVDPKIQILQAEANAIDAYFKTYDMPLFGMGMKMAEEAMSNDLDWRLLPAIAIRESTGGKHDCKKVTNNAFGWGSCKIGFQSNEEAIKVVAKNLGGNNPKTAIHYDNKTTKQILHAYNPPSIIPRYAEQVMKIMNDIGEAEITTISVNS